MATFDLEEMRRIVDQAGDEIAGFSGDLIADMTFTLDAYYRL